LTARVIAALLDAFGPVTASATDASSVAFHVRKSLAEKSSPVASLR
jgi:hypothetical protein